MYWWRTVIIIIVVVCIKPTFQATFKAHKIYIQIHTTLMSVAIR